MDLVDRHGRVQSVARRAARHPVAVAPLVIQIPHDRRRFRRDFVKHAEGIGFVHLVIARARNDVVLVERSLPMPGTNPSWIPEDPRGLSAWLRLSH
jgi:hypothetical protein